MKLNLACRETGGQISIDVDDEKLLLPFLERRIGAEVPADSLGDNFKGYVFKITGGNDKQGFPMLQGVLTNQRVRLLFEEGMKCYRSRRDGQKRRKSVRGCIVSPDLSVLNMVVVRKGANEIPELTDVQRPRRLGPKRASKIRKMYNLPKDHDVRPFVPRRVIKDKKTKAPKVQRLITATRLQRKRRYKRSVQERHSNNVLAKQQYKEVLEEYFKEKRAAEIAKKQKKQVPSASPMAS